MSVDALLIWIIVGAIAGWLAGLIVKGYGFGPVGNIILGIVGAFLGGWRADMALGTPDVEPGFATVSVSSEENLPGVEVKS